MLKTFSVTDIGKKRKLNQDYVFSSDRKIGHLSNVCIVADGMGGHNAGDYASRCAVETICKVASQTMEKDPKLILKKAIEVANETVYKRSTEEPELEGMGTTIVAATCMGQYVQIANVGDSRLYVIGDTIQQITQDHSWVEEMVRMGALEKEDARTHAKKNIITRALGAGNGIEIDFFSIELKQHEMLLLCSDGLTNMLEDEEIRMIVMGQRDIVEKAEVLVREANKRGGTDNISVVLVEPVA